MKYQETHPWISFQVDLGRTDPRLWLNLGEVASKVEHLAGVPLRPWVAERLHQIYLAKGAFATTAIEGNTLTEEQVLQHLRGELRLPESQEYLQQEVDNIVRACNDTVENLVGPGQNPELCTSLLCHYNREVRENLKEDEGISPPGRLRAESVVVGGVYRGAPAEDCPFLMDWFCTWINGEQFQSPDERFRVPYAIIKAIVSHLYMACIWRGFIPLHPLRRAGLRRWTAHSAFRGARPAVAGELGELRAPAVPLFAFRIAQAPARLSAYPESR